MAWSMVLSLEQVETADCVWSLASGDMSDDQETALSNFSNGAGKGNRTSS